MAFQEQGDRAKISKNTLSSQKQIGATVGFIFSSKIPEFDPKAIAHERFQDLCNITTFATATTGGLNRQERYMYKLCVSPDSDENNNFRTYALKPSNLDPR
ncbi:hypothetical protein [Coleofasciculus sp. H7-2]|uniref:hypothetical protein n=1 Tax=Coleofasciculus sp. H7-2 TaxID=3351545 RepID=UPI00366AD711